MGEISMNIIVKLVALTIVLSLLIQTAHGIMCFQCNSARDPGCIDMVDNSTDNIYYKECEPTRGEDKSIFFCRTITQTIKVRGNLVRVIRSCGWDKYKRDCYENEDEDHKELVCQCFTDGCNSRASLGTFTHSILAALAVLPAIVTFWRY